eukprot:223253-Chlamydomonas_euryale.AAC.3
MFHAWRPGRQNQPRVRLCSMADAPSIRVGARSSAGEARQLPTWPAVAAPRWRCGLGSRAVGLACGGGAEACGRRRLCLHGRLNISELSVVAATAAFRSGDG